jgi:hypothetical protein
MLSPLSIYGGIETPINDYHYYYWGIFSPYLLCFSFVSALFMVDVCYLSASYPLLTCFYVPPHQIRFSFAFPPSFIQFLLMKVIMIIPLETLPAIDLLLTRFYISTVLRRISVTSAPTQIHPPIVLHIYRNTWELSLPHLVKKSVTGIWYSR